MFACIFSINPLGDLNQFLHSYSLKICGKYRLLRNLTSHPLPFISTLYNNFSLDVPDIKSQGNAG